MKRILSLMLALLLTLSLTACGGNDGNTNGSNGSGTSPNNASTKAEQNARVIKPSELITLGDAERILGIDLQIYQELDKAEQYGGLRTTYNFDDGKRHPSPTYMFQINIHQNELLDEKNLLDMQMKARGGISFYNNSLKEGLELIAGEEDPMKTIWIEGVGDWASISRSPIHTINFAYGTYSMGVTITGQATDVSRSKEDESAWKVEKLIEAAMLAVERLNAIER